MGAIRIILLSLLCTVAYGQYFGGGGGTGTPNYSCYNAGSTTSCAITGLNLTATQYQSANLGCKTSTAAVSISSVSLTGSPITAVTFNYSATSGVSCTINLSGVNGSNGATGAGYATLTSTTSLTIAFGSQTFTITACGAYGANAQVLATYASNSSDWMWGTVTSCSGTSIVLNVLLIGGSGTYASWDLNLSGVTVPGSVPLPNGDWPFTATNSVSISGYGTRDVASQCFDSSGNYLGYNSYNVATSSPYNITIGFASSVTGYCSVNSSGGTSIASLFQTNGTNSGCWQPTGKTSGSAVTICANDSTSAASIDWPSYGVNGVVALAGSGAGGPDASCAGSTVPSGTTDYASPGNCTPGATEINRVWIVKTACTLQSFYFVTSGAQPSTGALVATLLDAGTNPASPATTSTGLTVTISASGAAQIASDLVHTYNVSAGHMLTLQLANAASSTSASMVAWGATCQ